MEQAYRFELLTGRKGTTVLPWLPRGWSSDDLPEVPVLPETLLKMELALHERSTDLSGFSEAILCDLGATIQILRMMGEEYGTAADRPIRIEDCISDLGPRSCLHAVAGNSLVNGNRQQAIPRVWGHAREVAQSFRLYAAQGLTRIRPEQAYVAGLLHGLGALPKVLGWAQQGAAARTAIELAECWHFPYFLRDFFHEVLTPGHSPEWSSLISIAHVAAQRSSCPPASLRLCQSPE